MLAHAEVRISAEDARLTWELVPHASTIALQDGPHREAGAPTPNSRTCGCVAESGLLDPLYDPANGELELAWAAPIIRAAAGFQLIVRVASVARTGETGRTWEARLQALAGTLTTNESLIGGSGWEAKSGNLRNDGYAWVFERLEELRDNGDLERRSS